MNALNPESLQGPVTIGLVLLFVFWERLRPLLKVERLKDLREDLFAILVVSASSLAAQHVFLKHFSGRGFEAFAFLSRWPTGARFLTALLLIDLFLYGIHRTLHVGPFWKTHEWHHSTRELYWFSGYRTSAIQAVLFYCPSAFLGLLVFRFSAAEILALSAVATFMQLMNHASVRVNSRLVSAILVTPAYHRLHHDRDEIRDRNFGAIFTLWDRVFGTYLDPRLYPEMRPVGLDDDTTPTLRRVIGF